MKNIKYLLFFILLVPHLQAFCTTALPRVDSSQFVKIILVRHAERANADSDAELSQSGLDRANRLATALKDVKIDELYATPFKRTKGTIEPIAKKIKKEVSIYKTNDINTFAETLRKKWGKTILVAGHSNTTPNLVNLLLKQERFPQMDDADFGKIFILTMHKSGATDVLVLNY